MKKPPLPHKFIDNQSNELFVVFTSFNVNFYKGKRKDDFEYQDTFKRLSLDADILYLKENNTPCVAYLNVVDELTCYLKDIMRDYDRVLFMGNSGGGLGSILYGSLCKVDIVLAINSTTTCYDIESGELLADWITSDIISDANVKYRDLKPFINDTTKYYINNAPVKTEYSDLDTTGKLHHIKNYEHLQDFSNVHWLKFFNRGFVDGSFLDLLKESEFKCAPSNWLR